MLGEAGARLCVEIESAHTCLPELSDLVIETGDSSDAALESVPDQERCRREVGRVVRQGQHDEANLIKSAPLPEVEVGGIAQDHTPPGLGVLADRFRIEIDAEDDPAVAVTDGVIGAGADTATGRISFR